jgi:hypothetical protein
MVEVPCRSAEFRHWRTQTVLGRIVPHPSHLTRPMRKVQLTTHPEKGTTTNRNSAQGKGIDVVRTTTSYFDPVWNVFSMYTDGSVQWIPKQIVEIG